tara:strand:- start:3953 stop:7138 length:3186 start_codon:yes stop_codon:yes gene_type:complete
MIRRTSIVCLEVVCGILVVTGLLVAGSAWRLSQEPVSIRFLLPYAEDLLQRQDTRFRAELDDLILTWAGWERALDVRALGVRLHEKNSAQPVARVGEVSLTLSARALIDGKVAPTSLEIIRPRIRLARSENGDLEIDVRDAASQADTASSGDGRILTLLLNELSGPAQPGSSLRYLNRISVVGAALRLEDRQMNISWGARHADITLERAASGLRTTFDLDIDLRTSRPEIHGTAAFDSNAGLVDVLFTFSRLNPGIVGQRFEALAGLKALTTELDGKVDIQVDLDGDIKRAEVEIAGSAGSLTLPEIDAPPFAFRKISFTGDVNRNPDQLKIGKLEVDMDDFTLELAGVVTRVGDIAAINASVNIPSMKADSLRKYWPPGTGGGARAWVLTNMRGGTYTGTTASLTARVPLNGENAGRMTVDSINGRMNIADITIDYLNPLPPITGGNATATFSDTRFDFAVQSGAIGKLWLEDGAVNITGIGSKEEKLSVSAFIRGPVRPALDLVAHPRLNLLSKVGLTTDGAAGMHATKLLIEFPLLEALKAEEVRVDATANIINLALADVLKGKGVSDGTVALTISNDGMTAKGTAKYATKPVRFEWKQDFSGSQDVVMRVAGEATADAEIRDLFDVYRRDLVEGPVSVNFVFEDRRDGTESLSAGINFTAAKFSLPSFEWAKLPDREATAEVTVLMKDGQVTSLPVFRIEAGVFRAAGKLELSAGAPGTGPVLEKIDLDRFILGPTSFAAKIRRAPDRSLLIDIDGSGFDAAPFISQDLGGIDAPELPALRLTGKFGKFWIGTGAPTNNVRLDLQRNAENWRRIVVEGELPAGGKAISVKMLPTADGHNLSVYSADAGSLLKAIDITDTIRDGSIEITGQRKGGGAAAWRGTAEMKRFRVADAPGFARLLTIASLTGINDTISGKGISFDRLSFPFTFDNDIATISEARAVGSELGITATGTVDFSQDAIDIRGTIIPAYTINSLLGNIPLIGTILTGEKGGGIFAASYTVNGPVEKPEMSVNPLSALAPGFLRNLLSGSGTSPTDGQTPDQEERSREENAQKPTAQ